MSFKINKIFILSFLAFLSFNNFVNAANKNQNIEPALRLADDREEVINRITNEQIKRKIKPFDEDEANIIKKQLLESEKIKKDSLYNPKKLYRTIQVDTSNLTKEYELFLAPNYITTLIFLDKSGNIWPIETYTPGLGSAIKHNPIGNGTLILQPLTDYARGNLVLSLVDSKIPITLTLEVGTDKVDYKTEVRVNDYGPNSQPEVFVGGDSLTNYSNLSSMAKFMKKDMFNLLEGVTPENYTKKETNTSGVEAWVKDKYLFIRTKDMLISPNLLPLEFNKVKSADDTYVYAVPYMPYIMLSRHGNIIKVKIK